MLGAFRSAKKYKFQIPYQIYIFLHASPEAPKTPNGKRGTIFVATLNSKNDMRVALSKTLIRFPTGARDFCSKAYFFAPAAFTCRLNTNYILSIGNKNSFAHSLPAEEEEQERVSFCDSLASEGCGVNQNPDFPGSARHVILTVKGAAENRSSGRWGRGPRAKA